MYHKGVENAEAGQQVTPDRILRLPFEMAQPIRAPFMSGEQHFITPLIIRSFPSSRHRRPGAENDRTKPTYRLATRRDSRFARRDHRTQKLFPAGRPRAATPRASYGR